MSEKICSITKERYSIVKHKTGVTIVLSYRPEYASTYALFSTKYGSMNTYYNDIKTGERVNIFDGTAHFLEHKLFENETEDAFTLYAQTGADANAYTTFDRTSYLFSCTDNFEHSFRILLNFVQAPYFTPDSIAKEQGIIGQEIKMYEDNPSTRVFWNLMKNIFSHNTVAIDTAGTVESISHITPELLYDCYNSFYNPENMVIVVCGPQKEDYVLELCDELLLDRPTQKIPLQICNEPKKTVRNYSETSLAVDIPIFAIGYKDNSSCTGLESVKKAAQTEIILEAFIGKASELYTELYSKGIINSEFESEYMYGNGFGATCFFGISNNPKEVYAKILKEMNKLRENGLSKQSFEKAKKSVFGRNIRLFNSVSSTAELMLDLAILNVDLEDYMKVYNDVTLEDCTNRINEHFVEEASSLSVISPYKKEDK